MSELDALHECENCGAQLPAPDAAGIRTCTFCHAVYTTAWQTPPPAVEAPAVAHHRDDDGHDRDGGRDTSDDDDDDDHDDADADADADEEGPRRTDRSGGVRSVVWFVVIAGLLAVPLYLGATRAGVGPLAPAHTLTPALATLPSASSPTVAFVALSTHLEGATSQGRVQRFDGVQASAVWTSASIPQATAASPFAVDAQRAYVAAGAALYAVSLTDGTLRWQGALHDGVRTTPCGACLAVIDGHVVVTSTDGTMQAFDPTTGAPAWSRHLGSATAKLVRTAHDLYVVDGSAADDVAVRVDLATGGDALRIDPTCTGIGGTTIHAGAAADYEASPSGDAVLVFFQDTPACVQSFDAASGALRWSVVAGVAPFTGEVRTLDSTAGLLVASGSVLAVIDPADPTYRIVATHTSSTYAPLGVVGANVIVAVTTDTGSPASSIAALDLQSGATAWEVPLGRVVPVGATAPANRTDLFTARLVEGHVRVVSLLSGNGDDHQLAIDAVDASTGVAAARVTVAADSHDLVPAFGPPQWNGAVVVTRVGDDTIQTIDTATARVVGRVP